MRSTRKESTHKGSPLSSLCSPLLSPLSRSPFTLLHEGAPLLRMLWAMPGAFQAPTPLADASASLRRAAARSAAATALPEFSEFVGQPGPHVLTTSSDKLGEEIDDRARPRKKLGIRGRG